MLTCSRSRSTGRSSWGIIQEPGHGHSQADRIWVRAHVANSEDELRTARQAEIFHDLVLERCFLEHLRHWMNGNRAGSRVQPHPLASATGVDERRDVFILTRDDDPASVVCKLLSNAIQALSSKSLSEDTLSVHEMADVPSDKARNLQGLRRKAIAMSPSIRCSPPHPVGEF